MGWTLADADNCFAGCVHQQAVRCKEIKLLGSCMPFWREASQGGLTKSFFHLSALACNNKKVHQLCLPCSAGTQLSGPDFCSTKPLINTTRPYLLASFSFAI